jgi:hypothetical protein
LNTVFNRLYTTFEKCCQSSQAKFFDDATVYFIVVDPNWFRCGSGSSDLGQCGIADAGIVKTKNFKILLVGQKFLFFKSENAIHLSLGLHEERPS